MKTKRLILATILFLLPMLLSAVPVTVHYKTSWASANIHYNAGSGWTTVPGEAMESYRSGWFRKTVERSDASLTFVFNDGSNWDNNGGNDYTSDLTNLWVANGAITATDPENGSGPVVFDPAQPLPGQQATITYSGSLASGASVILHWGYDGWQGVGDTTMTKTGDSWTVTITVPAAATTSLECVFHDGDNNWDNNGGSDYQASIGSSQDNTPPVVALTAPSPGATLSGTVTLAANASDNVGVVKVEFYRDSNKLGEDLTAPYSINWDSTTATNGSAAIKAIARDAAGNSAEALVSVTIDNDNTAPTVSAELDQDAGNVQGNLAIAVTASDDRGVAHVALQVDGQTVANDSSAPYSFSLDTSVLTNGSHTLNVQACDAAGNTAQQTIAITVNNGQQPLTRTIHFHASVPSRNVFVQYRLTGGSFNQFPGDKMTSGSGNWKQLQKTMEQGSLEVRFIYSGGRWDNNNGANYQVLANEVWIKDRAVYTSNPDDDTENPIVSLDTPAAAATVSGNTTISAAASDNSGVARVEFRINGSLAHSALQAPWTFTWDSTQVANGSCTIEAKAFDPAGNSASDSISVTVDNQQLDNPPQVTSLSVPSGSVTGNVTLSAQASDDNGVSKVEFYLGESKLGEDSSAPYSISFDSTTYPNGSHTVKAIAYDSQNQTGEKTATLSLLHGSGDSKIIHYKSSWSSVNIHYNDGSNWTTVPGEAMDNEKPTWFVKTVTCPGELTMCFNNGSDWDNNNGQDYKTSLREIWIKDHTITTNDPEGPQPPLAAFSATPEIGKTTTDFNFDASASSDPEDGTSLQYRWDYNNDGTWDSAWSSSKTALHRFTTAGAKTVCLQVKDSDGMTATATRAVMVYAGNIPPTANAGNDIYIVKGETAQFDGSGSSDLDGTIVSYQWSNGLSGANPGMSYPDSGSYEVTLTVTDNSGATATDMVKVVVRDNNSRDFREETIYFVMTARFYDGDPSNNVHCWADAQAGNPDSDPAWRGDFKGLIQKLDYIKALGFSAVWITPIVKNCSGYDYHGYHAINHKQVDPRLLSDDTSYQDLIDACHARGMKIVQDIVLNHSGNFGEENIFPLFTRNAPTGLNETIDQALTRTDPNNLLPANYDSLTPGEQYGARIAAMKEDANDTAHIYHHEKSMSWESYSVQTGQIAGDCVDLNTENPAVANYLVDAYTQYINMGVDAFRVDTVKHISRLTFNQYFLPAFKQAGGDNFFIFGEVCSRYRQVWNSGIPAISCPFYTWKESQQYPWGTREQNEQSVWQNWQDNCTVSGEPETGNHWLNGNDYHNPDHSQYSGMSLIDFPMHWNFANAYDAFNIALGGDKYYNDATYNVTYVDSHDYAPDCAPENQRFALGQDVWAENLSLMFTFRGIPCIYYGSEIEFKKGKPIDVGPNAPLEDTGRAYFGGHIEGSISVTDFGQYNNANGAIADTLNHGLARHIRRLNLIRRACPALQKGQYSTDGVSGGMAFKRRFSKDGVDSFVLVTVSGDATFSGIPNGTYVDAVTGDTKVVSGGSLSASCYGKGNARVYILNGPGKIGADGVYLK